MWLMYDDLVLIGDSAFVEVYKRRNLNVNFAKSKLIFAKREGE